MWTYAPQFPKEFHVFPARGLLAGHDQIKIFHVGHYQRRGIVAGMLDCPRARPEDAAQLFLSLRVSTHQQRNANWNWTQQIWKSIHGEPPVLNTGTRGIIEARDRVAPRARGSLPSRVKI